jgi:glycosyltransferase involved in cell wall biosynthesis
LVCDPQTNKYSSHKLKLLFTQDALVNAGAERSHLALLSRFKTTEVSLVYFYPKHDLKEEYEKAGLRLIFLDIPESYHFPLAISRLVSLIRKENPDLLVSCLWRADMITRIASWITGVPLVGTLVNDSYAPLAWKDKQGLKFKIVYLLDRITAEIPIHWIANAQALINSHSKSLGIDPQKSTCIYRGRAISQEMSVEKKPIRHFITYGRLLERKGFQDAIAAFAKVSETYPDLSLSIYGEGPYRRELETLIKRLKLNHKVKLPGKVSNPIELLFLADCFLFPSWYEGFSGALVEAMMAGIPIIASDIPMNLEAVKHKETALVFPVRNGHELAKSMEYALEHPAEMKAIGQRARAKAIEHYDIEKIAKQYEELLLEIYDSVSQKSK